MSGTRFTAWFDDEERDALEEKSRENHTSKNYLVRVAVRALYLGKPVPSYLKREEVQK